MNDTPQRSWQWKCLQVISRLTTTIGFDMKVWGLNNIPEHGGVLLLSNHQSFLDPILLALRLKRPVSYMARSDLFEKNRFFTWLIRSLHAFPIKRASADIGALKQAIAKLQEGHVLNVYPEGTRTKDGEIGPIQPGVSLVVRKAGVPVVPVVIDGSFQSWPRKGNKFRFHPVRIMFGTPMNLEGMKSEEIIALIDNTLKRMLVELRAKQLPT